MTKKSRQKVTYLEKKKAIKVKEKAIFCFFKELSVAKNCLRPGSAPSNYFVKDLTKNNLIFKIQVNAKNFRYN